MNTNKQAVAAQIFAQLTSQAVLDGSLTSVRGRDFEGMPTMKALCTVTAQGVSKNSGQRTALEGRLKGEIHACLVFAEIAADYFIKNYKEERESNET
jgi:hypothetical protein